MAMPNAWKYTDFCEKITHIRTRENFVHGKIHDNIQSGYSEWYTLYAHILKKHNDIIVIKFTYWTKKK